jgi:hypothetical protein
MVRLSLFRFDVFQQDPAPCLQTGAGLFDPALESRIVFDPIFKMVLLPGQPDWYFFHSDFRSMRAMTGFPIWSRSPKPNDLSMMIPSIEGDCRRHFT